MRNICLVSLLFVIIISSAFPPILGQGSAGTDAEYELRTLIDIPTAGILKKGKISLDFEILPLGTLISKIEVSPFRNFSLGVSYGAYNFIGDGAVDLYRIPGFHAKFRIFTENRILPSFSLGFNSQGKGSYIDSLKRFTTKSPGMFLALTKNYKLLGYLSFHSVVNYSLENFDDRNINFGFGLEKTIGPFLSAIIEYDFALNDNSTKTIAKNKGYLNVGFRLSPAGGLTIGADIKDLLENSNLNSRGAGRSLYIEYISTLF